MVGAVTAVMEVTEATVAAADTRVEEVDTPQGVEEEAVATTETGVLVLHQMQCLVFKRLLLNSSGLVTHNNRVRVVLEY